MKEVIETIRKIGEEFLSLADQLEKARISPGEEAAPVEAEQAPVEEKTPAEKKEVAIKLEDVRSVLADISRSGKTAEMKSLLSRHGVSKLSELDPGEYEAILAEAEVIRNA